MVRRIWNTLKFTIRWLGPIVIVLGIGLFIFPLGPFGDASSIVALAGAVVTTIGCIFLRAPERREGRKILAIIALVGFTFAGWRFWDYSRGFHKENVNFDNRGAHLAGTLYLPDRPGPAPGIVVVHGSGALPRAVYAGSAIQFAKWGYAVLVYDKRGTGDSTGHFENGDRTLCPDNIDLLASDASAAHDVLARRPEVRTDMVGFFGGSQAGWITPRAAALNGHAAFMLLLSGPTTSTHAWLRYERFHLNQGRAQYDPPTLMDIKKAFGRGDIPESMSADQAYAVAQKVSESTFPCDAYDPTTDLRALNIPGLWLMGDRDWMVPSEPEIHNLQRLRELGKPYEYRNIPGAGHSMQGGPKNLVEDTIKQWLARVTNQ